MRKCPEYKKVPRPILASHIINSRYHLRVHGQINKLLTVIIWPDQDLNCSSNKQNEIKNPTCPKKKFSYLLSKRKHRVSFSFSSLYNSI